MADSILPAVSSNITAAINNSTTASSSSSATYAAARAIEPRQFAGPVRATCSSNR